MPAEIKQLVTVVCDNEGCKQSLFWVENKPEDVPDNVFRILILQLFNQQKLIFCSKHCLLQYLNNKFVPLQSPREQNAATLEEQLKQNTAAVPPTAPTVESVPASTPAPEQAVLAPPTNAPIVPNQVIPDAPKVVVFPAEVVGPDSKDAPVVARPRQARRGPRVTEQPPVPVTPTE